VLIDFKICVMKKTLVFLSILSSVFTSLNTAAQDIHFSQFYENAILRNPALTGIFSGDYKAGVNYRQQWSNISVPFTTVLASAESRILVNRGVGDYLSYGVTATYDKAGSISFNSFQIIPAINFNKAIEDNHNSYLSLGFSGGYIQRSIDLSKATFSTQYVNGAYDPGNASRENMTNTVIRNYDLSAGLSLNSTAGPNNEVNYYIGVAGFHVTKPKHAFNNQETLIRLTPKYTANMGFRWNINEQYGFTAHMNYLNQSPYKETIVGGLLSWKSVHQYEAKPFTLHIGTFVRLKDAIIPTMKMDYQSYSVTVSYDINTSGLRPASEGMGGFEISLFTRGVFNKSDAPGSQTRCPQFEQLLPSSLQYD
jgi:type IX secretion system PorP/SprF family membrane protein